MQRVCIFVLVVVCSMAGTETAGADEAAWLYTPDQVTEIEFALSDEAREALAAEPDEYVRATFSLTRADGTSYGPLVVGLKLKGNASFRTLDKKAAFKVKFSEFVKGQKFLGLKKLTLNNMVQDPTMVHELLSYEAFRVAGLPSWRTGYSYVRMNGADYGLYLNIETPDDVSLKRWFPTTQHLYEGEWGIDLVEIATGWFEADQGDEDERSDLAALIARIADWRDVDGVADLDEITRYWAVERYIGHFDSYSSGAPNNYYLHSDAAGRFAMLPWGTDQTWERRLGYADPGGGVMFEKCRADAACWALYRKNVDEVRAVLGAHPFDRLASETEALLHPWILLDQRREFVPSDISAAHVQLQAFIAARPNDAWPPDDTADDPGDPGDGEDDPADDTDSPADGPGDQADGPGDRGDGAGDPRDGSADREQPADEQQSANAPIPPPRTTPADPLDTDPPALRVRSFRLGQDGLATKLDVPGPGRLTVRAATQVRGKRRSICRSVQKVTGAGRASARCDLNRLGRALMRSERLRATLHVRLVSPSGRGKSIVRSVTLARTAGRRR